MKKDGFYSSGEFAKMAHITKKTLRYYDAHNILKPSYLTPYGARFYSDEDFARLQIDRASMEAKAGLLRQHGAELAEKVRRVYAGEREYSPSDVDASVYDGFIADGDKRRLAEVRATPPAQLGERVFGFKDGRLDELLFRYRARNWPDTLTQQEQDRWDDYRRRRLSLEVGLSELTFESWQSELDGLRAQHAADGNKLVLLDQLQAWGNELKASLS